MRYCSIHNLDYFAQCDACAARDKDLDGDERLIRKQGLIATAGLIAADRAATGIPAKLVAALTAINAQHSPMRGEAKSDCNRYCSLCVHVHTGRSSVWPCRTARTCREALAMARKAGISIDE